MILFFQSLNIYIKLFPKFRLTNRDSQCRDFNVLSACTLGFYLFIQVFEHRCLIDVQASRRDV